MMSRAKKTGAATGNIAQQWTRVQQCDVSQWSDSRWPLHAAVHGYSDCVLCTI